MTAEKQDKTYNGWANYETWCVNLWLNNEEGTYRYWREKAAEQKTLAKAGNRKIFTEEEHAKYFLAGILKDELTEAAPEVTGLWADLLSAALSEVNWDEIAEGFLEE